MPKRRHFETISYESNEDGERLEKLVRTNAIVSIKGLSKIVPGTVGDVLTKSKMPLKKARQNGIGAYLTNSRKRLSFTTGFQPMCNEIIDDTRMWKKREDSDGYILSLDGMDSSVVENVESPLNRYDIAKSSDAAGVRITKWELIPHRKNRYASIHVPPTVDVSPVDPIEIAYAIVDPTLLSTMTKEQRTKYNSVVSQMQGDMVNATNEGKWNRSLALMKGRILHTHTHKTVPGALAATVPHLYGSSRWVPTLSTEPSHKIHTAPSISLVNFIYKECINSGKTDKLSLFKGSIMNSTMNGQRINIEEFHGNTPGEVVLQAIRGKKTPANTDFFGGTFSIVAGRGQVLNTVTREVGRKKISYRVPMEPEILAIEAHKGGRCLITHANGQIHYAEVNADSFDEMEYIVNLACAFVAAYHSDPQGHNVRNKHDVVNLIHSGDLQPLINFIPATGPGYLMGKFNHANHNANVVLTEKTIVVGDIGSRVVVNEDLSLTKQTKGDFTHTYSLPPMQVENEPPNTVVRGLPGSQSIGQYAAEMNNVFAANDLVTLIDTLRNPNAGKGIYKMFKNYGDGSKETEDYVSNIINTKTETSTEFLLMTLPYNNPDNDTNTEVEKDAKRRIIVGGRIYTVAPFYTPGMNYKSRGQYRLGTNQKEHLIINTVPDPSKGLIPDPSGTIMHGGVACKEVDLGRSLMGSITKTVYHNGSPGNYMVRDSEKY
jgi:hypothetical protein